MLFPMSLKKKTYDVVLYFVSSDLGKGTEIIFLILIYLCNTATVDALLYYI